MATNLAINEELLEKALKVGGLRTKKETVNQALREFVNRRMQLEVIALFGTLDPDPAHDHEEARRR